MISGREHFFFLSFRGGRAQEVSFDGDVFVAVSNSAFMFPFRQCLGGTSAPPHQTNPAFFSPAACRRVVFALSPLAPWKSESEVAFQLLCPKSLFGFLVPFIKVPLTSLNLRFFLRLSRYFFIFVRRL